MGPGGFWGRIHPEAGRNRTSGWAFHPKTRSQGGDGLGSARRPPSAECIWVLDGHIPRKETLPQERRTTARIPPAANSIWCQLEQNPHRQTSREDVWDRHMRPITRLHQTHHRWICLYGGNFKLFHLYLFTRSPMYQCTVLAIGPTKITLWFNISSPQMSSHFQNLYFHQCLEKKMSGDTEMSARRKTADFSRFMRCDSSQQIHRNIGPWGMHTPKLNFNVLKLFGLKDSESC